MSPSSAPSCSQSPTGGSSTSCAGARAADLTLEQIADVLGKRLGAVKALQRPELAPLAQALVDFRVAAFETLPQPSAELASRLRLGRVSEISESEVPSPDYGMVMTPVPTLVRAGSPRERE